MRRGCFGSGLASFAANTRQCSGKKVGGDIDFAAFYILPVPSSLSAKWRRVKIGSLPSFSPSLRMPPKHPHRSRAWLLHTRRLSPTFRFGAFFFVASALADVPSTRLASDLPRAVLRDL